MLFRSLRLNSHILAVVVAEEGGFDSYHMKVHKIVVVADWYNHKKAGAATVQEGLQCLIEVYSAHKNKHVVVGVEQQDFLTEIDNHMKVAEAAVEVVGIEAVAEAAEVAEVAEVEGEVIAYCEMD